MAAVGGICLVLDRGSQAVVAIGVASAVAGTALRGREVVIRCMAMVVDGVRAVEAEEGMIMDGRLRAAGMPRRRRGIRGPRGLGMIEVVVVGVMIGRGRGGVRGWMRGVIRTSGSAVSNDRTDLPLCCCLCQGMKKMRAGMFR